MARRIFGKITDQHGEPVEGLLVKAWDDDWPDGDDLMGEELTDAKGDYQISYAPGHWDAAPHAVPTWRPDIFISVHIRNAAGQWVKLRKSRVYENHRLSKNLRINLKVDIEEPERNNTSFKPRRHGFHFHNFFTISPRVFGIDLGTWNMGLCGGMCAGALNRFNNDVDVPVDTTPPEEGTLLYKELLHRQIRSLMDPTNIIDDIYDWQSAPDEGQPYRKHSVGYRTKKQWWKLKARLDEGKPTSLVLIRAEGYLGNLSDNHQVVAIGYRYNPTTKDLSISVYDPNHPDQTHTLSMNLGLPRSRLSARDSTGNRLRGFLVNPNGDAASS